MIYLTGNTEIELKDNISYCNLQGHVRAQDVFIKVIKLTEDSTINDENELKEPPK